MRQIPKIDTTDLIDKRNEILDAKVKERKKNTSNQKPSLLDALEIEEGRPEDPKTSIRGKVKENIDEETMKNMVQAFISNHPEKKEKLLKNIQQEVGIVLQL